MQKMRAFVVLAVIMSAVSLYVSFINQSKPSATVDLEPIKNEIGYDASRLLKLETDLDTYKKNFTSLAISYYNSQNTTATFSITDTDFVPIYSPYGNLLITLANAEKFGDGYKLIFRFGNPTSLTISGLKGKIRWRPRVDYQKYYSDNNYKTSVDDKTYSKDFEVLHDLYPGAWNEAVVTIGPATEEEIGEISISNLDAPKVSMRMVRSPH